MANQSAEPPAIGVGLIQTDKSWNENPFYSLF